MTYQEAFDLLAYHQRWRRGADIKMVNTTQLGHAIDLVLEYYQITKPLIAKAQKILEN